ncbi:MAG: cytidylate kinase family protein, partial [Marinifilaceae bacterium]|nr:cytidylate kinase family protein [Marinifilaceae bacterium]
MENKYVITIGRQFGSRGKEIGQALAQRLGIAFYDKELLTLASKESG